MSVVVRRSSLTCYCFSLLIVRCAIFCVIAIVGVGYVGYVGVAIATAGCCRRNAIALLPFSRARVSQDRLSIVTAYISTQAHSCTLRFVTLDKRVQTPAESLSKHIHHPIPCPPPCSCPCPRPRRCRLSYFVLFLNPMPLSA